jgi:hypothetical protein
VNNFFCQRFAVLIGEKESGPHCHKWEVDAMCMSSSSSEHGHYVVADPFRIRRIADLM